MIQKLVEPFTPRVVEPGEESVFVKTLWQNPFAGEHAVWLDSGLVMRILVISDRPKIHIIVLTPYDDVEWVLHEDSVRAVLPDCPPALWDLVTTRCDVGAWREL